MNDRLSDMKLGHAPRDGALVALMGFLLAAVLVACSAPAGQPAIAAGFAGYKWAVVSIIHDGKTTPVPGKYSVYLEFTSDGRFGANDSTNYTSGTYQVTPDGFTTGRLARTLAGYVGRDPVVLLSMSAISAFSDEVRALTKVSSSTLNVTVGSYTLVAQRVSEQGSS